MSIHLLRRFVATRQMKFKAEALFIGIKLLGGWFGFVVSLRQGMEELLSPQSDHGIDLGSASRGDKAGEQGNSGED